MSGSFICSPVVQKSTWYHVCEMYDGVEMWQFINGELWLGKEATSNVDPHPSILGDFSIFSNSVSLSREFV